HSSLLSRQRRLRFPLFPYTTLFRSPRPYSQLSRLEFHRPVECQAIPRITCRTLHPSLGGRTSLPARRLVGQNIPSSFGRWPTGSDRKSTRLNSSHVKISYAVFCLKK